MNFLVVSQKALAEALEAGGATPVNICKLSMSEIIQLKKTCFVQEIARGDLGYPKEAFMAQVLAQFPTAQWFSVTDWKKQTIDYFLNFAPAEKKAG